MTPEQNFAKNLDLLKRFNGVTNKWIGEQVHLSGSSISKMIGGNVRISLDVACQLCEVFAVKLTDMITGGKIV